MPDDKPTSFSEHAQEEEEEPEELPPKKLPRDHPFATFAGSLIAAISWFYQRCDFINGSRPKLQ